MKKRLEAPTIVTIPCGCQYANGNSSGPVRACDEHRYLKCARCGGLGEATPIGFLCPRCSFK